MNPLQQPFGLALLAIVIGLTLTLGVCLTYNPKLYSGPTRVLCYLVGTAWIAWISWLQGCSILVALGRLE